MVNFAAFELDMGVRGLRIRIFEQGRSDIEVCEPRMYRVAQNRDFGSHAFRLFSTSGFALNSFIFGNNCQTSSPTRNEGAL